MKARRWISLMIRGAGPFKTPYRLSPLTYKVGDKEYFNERPISTQQTAFTFVAQMRAELPDAIGGVLWFGADDANMTVFAPVYCCTDRIPDCYSGKEADCVTFSWNSAFWIYNWVADMIRPRYSLMIEDMRAVQNNLEDTYDSAQSGIENAALSLYEKDPVKAKEFLTNYSCMTAQSAVDSWKKLGEFLIVKYNDGAVKKMAKNGSILRPETGNCAPLVRPGYPQEFLEELVKATGERYKSDKIRRRILRLIIKAVRITSLWRCSADFFFMDTGMDSIIIYFFKKIGIVNLFFFYICVLLKY